MKRIKNTWTWALEQIILWDRAEPDGQVVHIHGDEDEVFSA